MTLSFSVVTSEVPNSQPGPTMSSLAWETTHGVSQRRLDVLEVFFKLLSERGAPINREHWAVSLALQLSFPSFIADPTPYVRKAWLTTRRLHPTIAGPVAASSNDAADLSDTVRILSVGPLDDEAWLATTFRTFAPGETDVTNSTKLLAHGSLRPYEKAMCHWIAASSEICIRAAHWRIDSIGMLMLAQTFLSAVASIIRLGLDADSDTNELEVSAADGSLTPSLHELVSAPADEQSTPPTFKARADSMIQDLTQGMPSISVPPTPGSESAAPGATLRDTVTLDATVTASVIAACKARGISVTSAIHAAIVRVVAGFPQHPLAKSYAAMCPADMRRYLSSPYSGEAYAVGCYCSGQPICIASLYDGNSGNLKGFDAIATEFNSVYRRDLNSMATDENGNSISMMELLGPFIRRAAKLVSTPPPPELPPVQNADLSSFGIIERYLQRDFASSPSSGETLELSDMWMGVELADRSVQCHLWTFRDRMTIQACYNESYYEKDFIAKLLGNIVQELLVGLGVAKRSRG